MISFREFLKEQDNIDETQIDAIYSKAHVAVELAKKYVMQSDNPNLLKNISVIANLASGAYGVYNTAENKKIIPQSVEQPLIYYGKIDKNNLGRIPKKTILQYYPNVPHDAIKESDTIHVNVSRILKEFPTDEQRITEIASTILHEAQHEWERENQGWTNEIGPTKRESNFMGWMQTTGKNILNSLLNTHAPYLMPGSGTSYSSQS